MLQCTHAGRRLSPQFLDWRCLSLMCTELCACLGGRFGYFLFFFCSGEGKRESEAPGGEGGRFLLKIPGGGVSRAGGGGAGRVFAGNLGRGAKYFFSGSKFPPRCIIAD